MVSLAAHRGEVHATHTTGGEAPSRGSDTVDQTVRAVFIQALFKARAEWRADAILSGLTTLTDGDGILRQPGHHVTAWFYSPSDCETRTIILGPLSVHSQPSGFATTGYRIPPDFRDLQEAIQKVRVQTGKAMQFTSGSLFVRQFRGGVIRPVWIISLRDPATGTLALFMVDANTLAIRRESDLDPAPGVGSVLPCSPTNETIEIVRRTPSIRPESKPGSGSDTPGPTAPGTRPRIILKGGVSKTVIVYECDEEFPKPPPEPQYGSGEPDWGFRFFEGLTARVALLYRCDLLDALNVTGEIVKDTNEVFKHHPIYKKYIGIFRALTALTVIKPAMDLFKDFQTYSRSSNPYEYGWTVGKVLYDGKEFTSDNIRKAFGE